MIRGVEGVGFHQQRLLSIINTGLAITIGLGNPRCYEMGLQCRRLQAIQKGDLPLCMGVLPNAAQFGSLDLPAHGQLAD
jgi:hypothetical protein